MNWSVRVQETGSERDTLPPLEGDDIAAATDFSAIQTRENLAGPIEPIPYKPVAGITSRPRGRFRLRLVLFLSALALLGTVTWYVFTAVPVRLAIMPEPDRVIVKGALAAFELGDRYLLRPGVYTVIAMKTGYYPAEQPIEVTEAQNQTFSLQLKKLPGLLSVITRPVDNARVLIDGEEVGQTPLSRLELAPGQHDVVVRAERYLDYETKLLIEGAANVQALEIDLTPAWAAITISSVPAAAEVLVDGQGVGVTPLTADLTHGEREIQIRLDGFKTWSRTLTVVGNQPQTLSEIALEKADGQVAIRTTPAGASVMVDGEYGGRTPLELALLPGKSYHFDLSKAGYRPASRDVEVESGKVVTMKVKLTPEMGVIKLVTKPMDAEVYVDGVRRGSANQRLRLVAVPHRLEIKARGFSPHRITVTPHPDFEQELAVTLKPLAQSDATGTPTTIRTSAGQTLRLVQPGRFTMGASRREQGRRSNETMYPVEITRPYYIATKEITNAEFREFQRSHSSGVVRNLTLDLDNHPVVRVSWEQAARYCNWLSRQESLPPVYTEKNGRLVAQQPMASGYRLPTEVEWAWAARFAGGAGASKYPWGEAMPPLPGSGNYADRSAQHLLANSLRSYDDGHPVTAPVGVYQPNRLGLFDVGGNVAEWVHDYYSFGPKNTSEPVIDTTGPSRGRYHVVRGSSWMHASISELRLAYRDYGNKARPDVGFRIARYAK